VTRERLEELSMWLEWVKRRPVNFGFALTPEEAREVLDLHHPHQKEKTP
jgi:hypothetical protein